MKKTFLILATLFFGVTSKSQKIVGDCTDLSGSCFYYVDDNIIVTNSEKTKGFRFSPSIDMKDGKLICDGITATLVNLGTCCENNTFILLLDDGSNITLKSWNKFNCKGHAFFNLSAYELKLLREHKIVKAQIQNGRTFDTFQNVITPKNQDYFFRFFRELDTNKYVVKK